MKFGISAFVTDEGIRPQVLGRAVEERGFEALFLPEHSHIPVRRATPFPMGEPLPRPYFRAWDPFVALAAAATATSTLLLGTGIALLIQRDVIHTAKEVASLDLLSRGRVIFGVGAGWNHEEMSNHGTDPGIRGALLDERILALKAIWTSDEAEFHGDYVDFEPIFQWPKPIQQPHPPVYIGGTGALATRRAARLGDGWMPTAVGDVSQVSAQLDLLDACGAPHLPVTVTMVRRDLELLAAYAEADVERVTLFLPDKSEAEALHRLDQLAALTEKFQ